MDKSPKPLSINLHKKSRCLDIEFDDGKQFRYSCEFLRVLSPSADVRGHGPGQDVLQTGKEDVNIDNIEPVGNYAIKLLFNDGHHTGLYSWSYLYELGTNMDEYWRDYLEKLEKAGHSRKQS